MFRHIIGTEIKKKFHSQHAIETYKNIIAKLLPEWGVCGPTAADLLLLAPQQGGGASGLVKCRQPLLEDGQLVLSLVTGAASPAAAVTDRLQAQNVLAETGGRGENHTINGLQVRHALAVIGGGRTTQLRTPDTTQSCCNRRRGCGLQTQLSQEKEEEVRVSTDELQAQHTCTATGGENEDKATNELQVWHAVRTTQLINFWHDTPLLQEERVRTTQLMDSRCNTLSPE